MPINYCGKMVETPYAWALEKNQKETAAYLRSKGGKSLEELEAEK